MVHYSYSTMSTSRGGGGGLFSQVAYFLGGQYSGGLFSQVAHFLGGLFSGGPFSGGLFSGGLYSLHPSYGLTTCIVKLVQGFA